jgi:hypothetical protein
MPADTGITSLLQSVFRETPGTATSVLVLVLTVGVALGLAIRAVERREYVLEQ